MLNADTNRQILEVFLKEIRDYGKEECAQGMNIRERHFPSNFNKSSLYLTII